jgi:DNA-binding NarL/FixJ family response regulator
MFYYNKSDMNWRIGIVFARLCDLLRRVFDWPLVWLNPQVYVELRRLAGKEGRPVGAAANELLEIALQRRWLAEERLQQWRKLTPREQQVAALVCLGYTNAEAAARLTIAVSTVSTHVRNILEKLGLRSKEELRRFLAEWDFSQWQ